MKDYKGKIETYFGYIIPNQHIIDSIERIHLKFPFLTIEQVTNLWSYTGGTDSEINRAIRNPHKSISNYIPAFGIKTVEKMKQLI